MDSGALVAQLNAARSRFAFRGFVSRSASSPLSFSSVLSCFCSLGERVLRVLLPAARGVRAAVHDVFRRLVSLPGARNLLRNRPTKQRERGSGGGKGGHDARADEKGCGTRAPLSLEVFLGGGSPVAPGRRDFPTAPPHHPPTVRTGAVVDITVSHLPVPFKPPPFTIEVDGCGHNSIPSKMCSFPRPGAAGRQPGAAIGVEDEERLVVDRGAGGCAVLRMHARAACGLLLRESAARVPASAPAVPSAYFRRLGPLFVLCSFSRHKIVRKDENRGKVEL